MIRDLIECFVWGWLVPLPLFFVIWLARSLKKYFTDASGISME